MKRKLDPIHRLSEVLFGLIMVLTFTGSLSVIEAGREDVRTMLLGALGCNLAWGLIDAVFYLMDCLADRARRLVAVRAVRQEGDPQEAHGIIAEYMPPMVASVLEPADLEMIRLRLQKLPEPPKQARLSKDEWWGALGVFLLVFFSMFPVAIPFIVMHDVRPALRISNAIALGLLFWAGYKFGRLTGRHPVWVGIGMAVFGSLLVGMTIALGG
jgi:VIT family